MSLCISVFATGTYTASEEDAEACIAALRWLAS